MNALCLNLEVLETGRAAAQYEVKSATQKYGHQHLVPKPHGQGRLYRMRRPRSGNAGQVSV